MLLLHGLGGSPTAWDRFVDCGRPGYEVWDVELPWHGMAEPGWSRRRDPLRVVADLVNGGTPGGAPRPFDVVVAHSYSAGLLLAALAAGEVRIGAAVLVSPFYRADAQSFDWPTVSSCLNDFHLVFIEALRVSRADQFSAEHREWLGRQLRDRVGPYGWLRFFELYLETPFLRLADVRTPVLVVRGDTDGASRLDDSRQLVRALPAARLAEIEGCGHFPMIERPERFSLTVASFLESIRPVPVYQPDDDFEPELM
jgi:pimeloyl-ACP methyl ester carboxylesterase